MGTRLVIFCLILSGCAGVPFRTGNRVISCKNGDREEFHGIMNRDTRLLIFRNKSSPPYFEIRAAADNRLLGTYETCAFMPMEYQPAHSE